MQNSCQLLSSGQKTWQKYLVFLAGGFRVDLSATNSYNKTQHTAPHGEASCTHT